MIFQYCKKNMFFLLFICITSFEPLQAQQPAQPIKIGIYDSRDVAIAYANSDLFQKDIENLTAEFKKAKEENNALLANELEKEGAFQQQLLHQQTFSVGTVSNIMDKIKDKLENIAINNGVSIIISKWEISYKDSSLRFINLTSQLVNLFSPSKQTLRWIESLSKQNPIPIDKLSIDSNK